MNQFRFAVLVSVLCVSQLAGASRGPILIGTYTGKGSEGIYTALFDSKTGKLGKPVLAAKTDSPSFVIRDAKGRRAYAANESSGAVTAFSVDRRTGALKELNHQ